MPGEHCNHTYSGWPGAHSKEPSLFKLAEAVPSVQPHNPSVTKWTAPRKGSAALVLLASTARRRLLSPCSDICMPQQAGAGG